MIRRSTAIAAAAIFLSLFVHMLGLTVTSLDLVDPPVEEGSTDVVELGNAFEDIAESSADPVTPEAAPVPEPPVEVPQEPETTEAPTSDAQVASDSPEQVTSPDAGVADAPQPEVVTAAEPETVEPVGQDEDAGAQEAVPPVEADADVPEPIESDSIETAAVDPALAAPAEPDLPTAPIVPEVSITPSPDVTIAPADVSPDTVVAAVPDLNDDSAEGTALAVLSSVRPRLPDRPPSVTPTDQLEDNLTEQRTTIESPLALYRRDGIDLFAGRSTGYRSQGLDITGSGGSGNSSETNYAGRVLVHLNSFPTVGVSARGSARVFFEISPDGSLAWVDVVDNTGSIDLERAAKNQVQKAAPFPVPPSGKSRRLSFVYRID